MTIQQTTQLRYGRKLTASERGSLGMTVRLSAEDWSEMTRAANTSRRHPSSMDRWREVARIQNPALSPDQAERLAERLRTQHYADMGRRSGAARRAAGQVAASLRVVLPPVERDV